MAQLFVEYAFTDFSEDVASGSGIKREYFPCNEDFREWSRDKVGRAFGSVIIVPEFDSRWHDEPEPWEFVREHYPHLDLSDVWEERTKLPPEWGSLKVA